ncbi:MAG: hypothetical protein RL227_2144 [Pseudomonadota bacterium]
MLNRPLIAAAAIAGLALPGFAFAQALTWNFADRSAPGGACTGTYASNGNTINCQTSPSGTTTTLQARAYSSTGTSGRFETASVNDQSTSGFGSGNRVEGYAVTAAPGHAFDNDGTGADALLLDFEGVSRVLSSVTLGWSGADADFQVLRWTGAANATITTVQATLVGKTAAETVAVAGGWELVSSVAGASWISNPTLSDQTYGLSAVNAQATSSSYWLISAYNSGFGGTGVGASNDTFTIVGVTTRVSAPGTLALAGLGLLGAAFLRRRNA